MGLLPCRLRTQILTARLAATKVRGMPGTSVIAATRALKLHGPGPFIARRPFHARRRQHRRFHIKLHPRPAAAVLMVEVRNRIIE